jgi:hypothetical protein
MAKAGQPIWWYRFSYVAEALRASPKWKGTPHGFESPYVFDLPAAVVKDKVTPDDTNMAKRPVPIGWHSQPMAIPTATAGLSGPRMIRRRTGSSISSMTASSSAPIRYDPDAARPLARCHAGGPTQTAERLASAASAIDLSSRRPSEAP